MLCALIMAGGKGTRFWPLSTEEKPKQFLNLIGDKTMVQMTVERIKDLVPIERIFICTGEKYLDLVKDQLPEISERNIIIEPEGRNTAPCITLSALVINRYYPDSKMVVLPSDHLIKDEYEFKNIIKSATKYLDNNKNSIITLGMKPSRAEVGYGYIKCSKEKINLDTHEIVKVDSFVEKPDKITAESYISSGNYLWNGGMFIWNINNILEKIKKYIPSIYELLNNVNVIEERYLQAYINENYKKTEEISIDYAVLEKTDSIYVIPSDFGWDDIGTWKAVERYKAKDKNNNILSENTLVIESEKNITINNKKKIVMIGIKDIMTVETDEAIFMVNKNYMDNLREYKSIL